MSKINHTINHDNHPDERIYHCELAGCPNKFKRKHGHSIAIAYATPGLDINEDGTKKQYPAHMCEHSLETGQHWACSHEHAVELAHACLDEHHNSEEVAHKHSKKPTLHQE